MNEPLNELYCVRQRRFIFGFGWNADAALSMFDLGGGGLKERFSFFSLLSCVKPVAGMRGSCQPPAPRMNHVPGSSQAACVAWFKIAPVPSFGNAHRK